MFTNNSMALKIVIPGGSGQVGTVLARAFHSDGHKVVVLSRHLFPVPWRVVEWDGASLGKWTAEVSGCDAVINLAGRSVNCRYGAANRREILDSRIDSTRAVGRAIAESSVPPKVWLQASTATIYAHRFDQANDEYSGILGGAEPNAPDTWTFSIDVATAWERTFNDIATPNTRKVALRSAMTMSPDKGGVFDAFASLVPRGLGGAAGDGRQFVSWIHHDDFTRAIYWLIAHQSMSGVVNLAAPNPLPNSEFMRALREAAGVRFGLPIPSWLLEVGALFIRTETELILKSRRVVPARLLESGFEFRFPAWPGAARDLMREWTRAGKRR